jgi:Domain of unknown function (DUF4126)
MSDLALSIVLGVALAAATGFRVFLPMLIVSGAAYTGHLHLDDSFAWLGSPSALIMLGVAAVAEVMAYYIPVVDNLLDTVATPAAFVAGVRGCHDRCAPNGEMDGGRNRRRGRRRTYPRADRDSSGSFDRPHGRPCQSGHRDRGARECGADIFPRAGCADRRGRAGRAFLAGGCASAAAAISRSEIIGWWNAGLSVALWTKERDERGASRWPPIG